MSPALNQDTNAAIDCLVVGGGPAGLTATLYLRRFHRHVELMDAGQSRALRIDCTRNMPGFPKGITGEALLAQLRAQVLDVHGSVTQAEVQRLSHDGQGGFSAIVDGRQLAARRVVLATGVVDNEPALPGLAQLREHGLLRHCPVCDGYEHTGQRILVMGDGAHAMSEASFLTHYSPQVTLVGVQRPASDGDTPAARGVACLAAPAHALRLRRGGGLALALQDGSQHDFDVLYVAMGVAPRRGLATSLGARLDAEGNLEVDAHCRTSVPGLFAVGDAVGGLDQLVVAAAQGAIAATAVHNSL